MIKVFNSPFRITQKFGKNPDYYKKFGLAGHEGLDIVPTTSDWTIFSLPYPGVVIKDIDMGVKGGAYGIHCTIWYKEINEAWIYCHMASNKVYLGQEISPTSPIGAMGNTGNTTGPHVHITRLKVDARGYRLDKDNGYLGGIDPLPFLMKDIGEGVSEVVDEFKKRGIDLLEAHRGERKQGPEGNWEGFARAIIQNDRDIVVLKGDLANAHIKIGEINEEHEKEKKAIREELKQACESEQLEKDQDWQKKVESAKIENLKEATSGELFEALLSKIIDRITLKGVRDVE